MSIGFKLVILTNTVDVFPLDNVTVFPSIVSLLLKALEVQYNDIFLR